MLTGLMAVMFILANKGVAGPTIEELQTEKWNTLGALELERKFKISEPPPKSAEQIAEIDEEYAEKKVKVSQEYYEKIQAITVRPEYVLSGDTINALQLECNWVDVQGATVTNTTTGNLVQGKLPPREYWGNYWANQKCVSDMSCTIGLKPEYNTQYLNPILSKIMWGDANAKYGQKVSVLVEDVECYDYNCSPDSYRSDSARARDCFDDWMHRGSGAKVQEMTQKKSKKPSTSKQGGTNAQ